MLDHDATGVDTLKRAREIGRKAGLSYIYLGNVAVNGDTHCPKCDELLIDRKGYRAPVNKLKEKHCPKCDRLIEGVW